MQKTVITKSEKQTLSLGKTIGRNLRIADVIALVGDLGSGKTVLVKGIAQGLKVPDAQRLVNSPSFVLIKEYPGKINLFHFDLYRLNTSQDIEQLGWEEYLDRSGVLVIEWADKMEKLLPQEYLRIELEVTSETKRRIRLVAKGERYKELIRKVASRE